MSSEFGPAWYQDKGSKAMAIRSFFAKSRAARSANGRPDDVTNEREVEITPAMMEAGVIAYYDAPEWAKDGELPEGAVKRIYSAMEAARFAGSGAALRPLRNEFGSLDHLDQIEHVRRI